MTMKTAIYFYTGTGNSLWTAKKLAEKLLNILTRTVRTSCAAETINSVLRPYLVRCRECTDLTSRQLFLNLFVLWFNMHKFDRGPRQGKSPYEIAGIDLSVAKIG